LSSFFSEKEQIRFISYLTITVCSTFEIYVKEVVDNILDKLIENPSYYSKLFGVEVKDIIRELNKKERNNAVIQIDNLLRILNLHKSIKNELSSLNFGDIPKLVIAIIEFRNKIIHEMPFPDLSILEKEKVRPLKKYVEDRKKQFEMEASSADLKDFPIIFKPVLEEINKAIISRGILIAMFNAIPKIILIYAAIFDNIINIYFNK